MIAAGPRCYARPMAATLARCLALAAMLGCSGPAPRREAQISNTAGERAGASSTEHEAIVAAVLDRFAADPETLLDAGLLPQKGPLYVLTEIGGESEQDRPVQISTLPRATRPYVGKTLAELQAEADRKNEKVTFIHIYTITIKNNRATVSSGADILLPRRTDRVKLCCCLADDVYEKRGGRWTFARRSGSMCS
jgi:hypothetical protein